MAKGMGNGFPIGGVLIHPKFEAKYGLLGTTFGGNHLACAAGIAVLDVLKDEALISGAQEKGKAIMARLSQLDGVKEVRGKGLMIGLEFGFPIKELRTKLLFEHRVFTGSSSDPHVLRLLPPLNISQVEIDIFFREMKAALSKTLNHAQS